MSSVIDRPQRAEIGAAHRFAPVRPDFHRTMDAAFRPGARLTVERETLRRRAGRTLRHLAMKPVVAFWAIVGWLTADYDESDERFFESLDLGVAVALIVLAACVGLYHVWGALA